MDGKLIINGRELYELEEIKKESKDLGFVEIPQLNGSPIRKHKGYLLTIIGKIKLRLDKNADSYIGDKVTNVEVLVKVEKFAVFKTASVLLDKDNNLIIIQVENLS